MCAEGNIYDILRGYLFINVVEKTYNSSGALIRRKLHKYRSMDLTRVGEHEYVNIYTNHNGEAINSCMTKNEEVSYEIDSINEDTDRITFSINEREEILIYCKKKK